VRLDLVHGDDQLLHHPQTDVGRRHGRIGTLDHSIRDDELIERTRKRSKEAKVSLFSSTEREEGEVQEGERTIVLCEFG
jgi:hypothetical protein